ncbi:branched-chain amino acid ABC transporter permease [Pigmentiphaga litoralis]|uniref:Branched-chain amino acid transport system permease protein n=1 Tax=Pigmentiphaga litoralis TaxID=516702 RepID=A0A7Y9IRE5_9BURK|nr:branched-chain amino acid ABC transporter permease [Pigmentiphaga litoralis]NYE25444.1 branched-chain amino acid transport system permease protein [Pigmentiphaga litoralis]NYE80944.1 branched-chain amino acid transport system permease protein [Pigmentiphaga litoralis]
MGIVIFDGLAYGMLLFLIGVGLSITLGLMNFVNLAHGAFAMVGGYAASLAMTHWQVPFLASLALAFVAAALAGAILEWVFFRRLYRAHPLDHVLLSIGIVFVAVAGATYLFGPGMQPFRPPVWMQGQVTLLGLEVGAYRLFLIGVGIAILLLLMLLLEKTRYGAMVRAAVDNQRVAKALGVRVERLFFLTFAFGCGLAGLGGALGLGILGLEPTFALKYMVYFLIVVCVGGAGTLLGPFVAAVLVGIVDVAGKYYYPEAGAFLIYVVMVLVLLVRPRGLIPKRGQA